MGGSTSSSSSSRSRSIVVDVVLDMAINSSGGSSSSSSSSSSNSSTKSDGRNNAAALGVATPPLISDMQILHPDPWKGQDHAKDDSSGSLPRYNSRLAVTSYQVGG